MKNRKTLFRIAALALSAVMLAGCGKSEFGVIENTEKKMVIYPDFGHEHFPDSDDIVMQYMCEMLK